MTIRSRIREEKFFRSVTTHLPGTSRFLALTLFAATLVLWGGQAQAASDSWNANAADNWTTTTRWLLNNGTVPGSTSADSSDVATFSYTLTAGRAVTVDTTRYIGGISFGNSSGFGYTLQTGGLYLNSGGVIQTLSGDGAHTETISSAIRIDGDPGTATFTAGASSVGSILSLGAVTGNSSGANVTTLTLNGANTGANAITGVIGNGGAGGKLALIKDGTGTWTLSGANTFTGGVTLNTGTLKISNATALGTVAGTLTINGGALDSSGINMSANNPQSWSGNFTYASTGGDLNLGTGVVAMNASRQVTVSAGALTVGGVISGNTFSLTKNGGGTLVLSGANAFNGGVVLNAGTLNIQNISALGNAAGTLTITGGALDSNSKTTGNYPQNWNGDFTYTGDSGTLNLGTGAVAMNASRQVTVNANTLTVGGIISGSGLSLTKSGLGTLVLSGANTFNGGVVLNAGTLNIQNISALGDAAGTLTITGGALDSNNKTTSNYPQNWNGDFSYIGGSGALNLGTGSVTMNASRRVTVSASTLTVGGAISGNTFSLTKYGAGTLVLSGNMTVTTGSVTNNAGNLTLSGNNSYSGTTVITGGVLQANDGAGLPTASFLSLDGGVLQNNSMLTFSRALGTSGSSKFQFAANGGGFAANTGVFTVNIGGASAEQVWGATVGSQIVGTLQLGSATANNKTLFLNPIDLNGATRTINATYTANEISGAIRTSSGTAGLVMTGTGTLTLSGANTYNGPTTISGGALSLQFTTGVNASGVLSSSTALTLSAGSTLNILGEAAANADTQTFNGTTLAGGLATVSLTKNSASSVAVNLGTLVNNTKSYINFTIPANTALTASHALDLSGALLGAWASVGSGGSLAYAADSSASGGTISSYTAATADAGNLASVTSPTVNYKYSAAATLAGNPTGNTLQYTGGVNTTALGTQSLTLNGLMNSGTGLLTISGTAGYPGLVIGASGELDIVANTQGVTINSVISGSGAVVYGGPSAGTLTLSGANTFTGGFTLNNGIVKISNNTAIGSGTLTINGGKIDSSGSITLSNNPMNINGGFVYGGSNNAITLGNGLVTLGNSVTITFDQQSNSWAGNITDNGAGYTLTLIGGSGDGQVTYSGTILQLGALVVSQLTSKQMVLSGTASTFTGSTSLLTGRLKTANLTNAGVPGPLGAPVGANATIQLYNGAIFQPGGGTTDRGINLASNGSGTVTINPQGATTINGLITVTGACPKTLFLQQTQNSVGSNWAFTLNSGIPDASDGSPLTLMVSPGYNSGIGNGNYGNIYLNGANTFSGPIIITGGVAEATRISALNITGGGQLGSGSYANTITISSTWGYFICGSSANQILSGVISGAGNLTMSGTGTLTLSGANTYSGATTISGGTLLVKSPGSLASGSAVAVNAGGTLGGNGTVNGAVTAAVGTSTVAGGKINLCDSAVGTLTLGSSLTFNGTATYPNNLCFDLGNAGNNDKIIVSGAHSAATASGVLVNLSQLSGTTGSGTYTLIQGGAASTFTGYTLATTRAGGNVYSGLGADTGNGNPNNLAVTVAAAAAGPAAAYWSGAANATWTGANWKDAVSSGNNVASPGVGSNVRFYTTSPAAGNLTTSLDSDFEINSLNFLTTATSAVSIVPVASQMLTIDATSANGNGAGNGVFVDQPSSGTPTHTISAKVGLAGGQTWTVNTGAALTVSGVISDFGGGYSLTKAGDGTLTLSGANLYSGATTNSAGTLTISGSINNSPAVVVNGGTLSVSGNINSTPTVVVNGGTLSTTGGDKLADNAAVTVAGGTLTIAGGDDTVRTLTMSSGVIGGSRKLTATTYTLSGGTVTGNLGAGTLTISGAVALNGTEDATTVNVASGTLTLGLADRLINTAVVNLAGGTLAMGAYNDTIAYLQFDGSTKAKGTWGSTDSSANHKSARFSGTGILTVSSGGTSTTTLTSSGTPTTYGGSVTFTATVTSSGGIPTGTVTFKDGGTTLGTGTLSGGAGNTATATLTLTTLTFDTHSITAVYNGDDNFDVSTSSAVSQVVNAKALSVKANDVGRVVGAANPTFTYTITGYVNGDTAAVVSGAPALGTGAVIGDPEGSYTITCGAGSLSAGNYTFTLVNGTLYVMNSATWAAGTGVWDINATLNWQNSAASTVLYADGVPAIFNDTPAGAGPFTVTLNTNVFPASVTVSNETKNYIISGSGGISNAVGLTKQGAGTLTLNNVNTYSNTTTISEGTLALGASGSIVNSTNITIAGGATFDVSLASPSATLGAQQTLQASGSASGGTLKTDAGHGLTLSSVSPLKFSAFTPAGSGGAVPLTVSGADNLVLGATTPVTITVSNNLTPLSGGYYKLIATNGSGGVVTTVPSGVLTVNGDGAAGGAGLALQINDGELFLVVSASAPTKLAVLSVNGDSNPTAGIGFDVVVQSQDAGGIARNVIADSIVTLTRKTGTGTVGGTYQGTISAGSSNVTISGVTYTKAESPVALTATSGSLTGDSSEFSVIPGAATTLVVSGFPGSTTAGAAHNVTVTATDSNGNTATNYAGTVSLGSTDGQAVLPGSHTFVSGDAGVYTFSVTLKTAGSQSIMANDGAIAGGTQSGITVSPASAASLSVFDFPSSSMAVTANSVTVAAKDPYGNTDTAYAGTITFSVGVSDGGKTLPGNYTFVPATDLGSHNFVNGVTLSTPAAGGSQSITATDTGNGLINGTQSGLTVTASTNCLITAFDFGAPLGAVTVTGTTITTNGIYGTMLTPTYTISPYATATPASGSTTAEFITPQTITVVAQDPSYSNVYTVAVTGSGTFNWTNTANGVWSRSANWTNVFGVGGPIANGDSRYSLNFYTPGTYTASNDLAATFALNQLNFGGPTLTLAGNSLMLTNNGAALPQINQNSANGITVSNNLVLGTNVTFGGTDNGAVTISGGISGPGSLTKTNSGTLTLNAANTYTGGTTLNNGTLVIKNNNGIGANTLTINGGTVDVTDITLPSNPIVINSSFIFYVANAHYFNIGSGPVTLNNTADVTLQLGQSPNLSNPINNNGYTLTLINTQDGTTTISGKITGSGGLSLRNDITANSKTLTVNNTSSDFTGPTTLLSSTAANLAIVTPNLSNAGSTGSLGAPTGANATIQINNNAVWQPGGTTDRGINLASNGSGNVTITLNNSTATLNGPITATGTGAKTLYLNLPWNNPGALTIGGAISDVSDGSQLTLRVQPGYTDGGNFMTINLSGTNTFTGPITYDLPAGTPNKFSSALNITGAGRLGYNSITGIANYANTINLSASSWAIFNYGSSADQQLSGAISGAGNLTMSGSGTLTLSAANTYSGVTTVSGGCLVLNNANAIPGGIGNSGGLNNVTIAGGVIGLGSGDFTRTLNTVATTTAATFTGNGGWAAYGADRVVNLNNDSHPITWETANTGLNGKMLILSYSNATHMVDVQNPLDLGTAIRTVQVGNGTAAIDGKLSGVLSGTTGSGLTKTGAGTLWLSGANTYYGPTVVSNGVIAVGNNLALSTNLVTLAGGSLSAAGGTWAITNVINLVSNTAIDTVGNNLELAGSITNRGSLTKTGAGTLTLSAANTYSNTTINAGTLALSGAGTVGNSTNITVAGGATFDVSARTTALTLGAAQTLQIGGGATGATLSTAAGKGLILTGAGPLNFSSVTNGFAPLTLSGAGDLTLNASTPVTVAVSNGGTPWPAGSYKLVATNGAGGVVGGTLPAISPVIGGDGVAAGFLLQINNGELYLVVTSAAPTKLAILSVNDGASPVAGTPFSVVVQSQDGDSVAQTVFLDTPVTLTLKAGTSSALGGTLTGTILAGSSNVTISLVHYTKAEPGVRLTASGGSLTGDSTPFTVVPGAASQLRFTTQPASSSAGTTLSAVVEIEDANSNAVAQSGTPITLALTGSTLSSGTNPQNTDGGGKATFSDLVIQQAGNNLHFTANGGGLPAVNSTSFNITWAAASKLAFGVQPAPTILAGDAIIPAVTVLVQDQYGNTVSNDTRSVTMTSDTTSFTNSTTVVSAASGKATFAAICPTTQGGLKTLIATDGVLVNATSSYFAVSANTNCLMTSFSFGALGAATISGTSISKYVPVGTDVSALSPTYAVSLFATANPESGSEHDFRSLQTYTVTAQDGIHSKVYAVEIVANQDFYWTNTASSVWAIAGNWTNSSGGSLTSAGDCSYSLDFYTPGTYTASNNLDAGFVLNQLNFGGPVLTLNGNSLVLTNNGAAMPKVNQNSANAITISNLLSLATNVTVGGSGSGAVTATSEISGTGRLTKSGTGTLTLSGANTFTGGFTLNNGTVVIGNNNGIGANTLTINGGTVNVTDITLPSNLIVINNSFTFYVDTARNFNIGSGPVTLNNTATVTLQLGQSPNLSNPINNNGYTLTLINTQDGTTTISGKITGSGGLTLRNDITANNKTLIVNNTSSDFTGQTTLLSSTAANLAVVTPNLSNVGIAGSLGAPTGANAIIQINNNAVWQPGGTTDRGINLASNGSGTVTITLNGNNAILNGPITATGTGAKTLYLNLPWNNPGALTIGGAISDVSDGSQLTLRVEPGYTDGGNFMTINLSGVSTFTGPITYDQPLYTPNKFSSALNITGAGCLGYNSITGIANYANTINLSTSSWSIFNYGSSANQILAGAISGAGNLTMSGSGTLTLSGANTYSGATTVSGGALVVNGQSGSNSGTGTGAVAVNAGGTLSGNGRISGAVTVANSTSAVLYPNSSSALTLGGNLSIGAASVVKFNLASTASGANDKVVLENKAVTITGTPRITINLASTTLDMADYVLIDAGAGGSISGAFNTSPTFVGVTPKYSGQYSIVKEGNTIVLRYSPIVLTVTGAAVTPKPYDGTFAATITGATLAGAVVDGDAVNLSNAGTGTFASKNVGTGIAVVPSMSLSGADSVRYTLTPPALTGNITKSPLGITAAAQSKTYGQTVTFGSGRSEFSSSGLQNGETIGSVTLACAGGAAAASAIDSPYTITPSAATGGTFDPDNYTITYNNGLLTVSKANQVITFTLGSTVRMEPDEPQFSDVATAVPVLAGITYSSDNEAVATVNTSSGMVTINGVGIAVITAAQAGSDDYNAGQATQTLTVNRLKGSVYLIR